MNDPAIVFIGKLLALFVGVELANIIAPQLVIIVGAVAGASFGLADWRQCTRLEAFGYVLSFSSLAWLLAGSVSTSLGAWFQVENAQFLLSPCAIGIGWVGHRWPKVGAWAAGIARSIIERKAQQ